jgi:hypothetical protein
LPGKTDRRDKTSDKALSEYQYYEFLSLDRPLTAEEQDEVRRLSSRAEITATSFTNEYHWGDFRGSPAGFMRRYYDGCRAAVRWLRRTDRGAGRTP